MKHENIQTILKIYIKSHLLTDPNAGQNINSEVENFKLLLILKIIDVEFKIIKNKNKASSTLLHNEIFI